MKKIIILITITIFLSACAIQKNWEATGGSKADGVIELSYTYGMFENPQLSEQQALDLAIQKCSAWGYKKAEAFGGAFSKCSLMTPNGCSQYLVTKGYQCIN
jgi:hypothetical protein